MSVATVHVVVRDTECVFNAIPPNWLQWLKVNLGYRARFLKEIRKFQVSHGKTINHAIQKESPFRSLAKLSLVLLGSFAKEIIAFFEESMEEFTLAKLSKEKAMHVGSSVKSAIIELVAEPRSGVVASLKTVAAVTVLEFKNYPKVSSDLVNFLIVEGNSN